MNKTIISILLIGFLTIACEKTETPIENEDQVEILELVNNLRLSGCQCGSTAKPSAAKLTWDTKLETAAKRHAEDMEKNSHFSHVGTDNSTFSQRITDAGYVWTTCGENIALWQKTNAEVIESWKNSEWHCLNIMNQAFTHIAVARKGDYWVMVLAK
jgi:uncharacterized protein YkwD